jgi:hypothetical protein
LPRLLPGPYCLFPCSGVHSLTAECPSLTPPGGRPPLGFGGIIPGYCVRRGPPPSSPWSDRYAPAGGLTQLAAGCLALTVKFLRFLILPLIPYSHQKINKAQNQHPNIITQYSDQLSLLAETPQVLCHQSKGQYHYVYSGLTI